MKVLVTGNQGMIGSVIQATLKTEGFEVIGFDLANGDDIRNLDSVRDAVSGCDFIVHLAALLGYSDETAEDIMDTNLLGTWHVLLAAAEARVKRIIFFSSVDVLGIFKGERTPDYLPLDDNHPCYPKTTYGISKYLAEEMCRLFTNSSGISTICFRPPGVFDEEVYEYIRSRRQAEPEFEWKPFWEYGAFIDVRDLANATICALKCPDLGHVALLLCADDISSAQKTSRELASSLLPGVSWRGGLEFDRAPYKALIDTTQARQILGWIPRYHWRG